MKTRFVVVLLTISFLCLGVYAIAGQIVKPYTFTSNTTAKSSEVNENFDVLYNAVNNMGIPQGAIIMWSGDASTIPSGWALCNGSNGTPDLRDRFIVGSGNLYQVGTKGGEAKHTLTEAEIPSHTHIQNEHSHLMGKNDAFSKGSGSTIYRVNSNLTTNPTYTQNATATNQNTGGGAAHNNMPPYYALCFIMKL